MTLVSALVPMDDYTTGDMEFTIAIVPSISGLQEIEPGWVLANGVVLPAGVKYDSLRTMVGTSHGANGTLPTFIDGVTPIGKGASTYTTLGATDGATSVVLTLAQIWNHQHQWQYESTANPLNNGWANMGSTPPFDDGGYEVPSNSDVVGGGGAHNNMPPFVVVEGKMIKL